MVFGHTHPHIADACHQTSIHNQGVNEFHNLVLLNERTLKVRILKFKCKRGFKLLNFLISGAQFEFIKHKSASIKREE